MKKSRVNRGKSTSEIRVIGFTKKRRQRITEKTVLLIDALRLGQRYNDLGLQDIQVYRCVTTDGIRKQTLLASVTKN